jgi:N-methylhydantoinase A/oxoprolinase/acetone carboxylase beta subunit
VPRSQARPLIFDLQIRVPDVLYEEVVEVDEEVLLPLGTEPDRCTWDVNKYLSVTPPLHQS